jgi:two-component system NarL family sensor kinase
VNARARLRGAGGAVAVIRLLAVPVFYAAERLVDHPAQNSAPFAPLLAVAGAYAVLVLAAELWGRPLAPAWVLTAVDVTLICLLVATSGGPFSQLTDALFVLPIGAALLLGPRATLGASAAVVIAYALITVTYPGDQAVRPDARGFEVTKALFLAWMGGAATLLSALLARREREVKALADSRGRLVAQALDAEDMARRRLAEALHDEALQNVLAARQELGAGEHARLDLVAEGLDATMTQLRAAVFDLHPHLLEHAGLGPALKAVADRAAGRAGFTVQVDLDATASGSHDQLLFSIGRELIANVAAHAAAGTLWLGLHRRGAQIELTIADDGRGIDLERAALAPQEGHIGLASSAERAEAVGGSFEVGPGPGGRGTLARVRVPAA